MNMQKKSFGLLFIVSMLTSTATQAMWSLQEEEIGPKKRAISTSTEEKIPEQPFKLSILIGNIESGNFRTNCQKPDISEETACANDFEETACAYIKDNRVKVEKPINWPSCVHGVVQTPRGQGTGALIGPNLVLTCAHVLYDHINHRRVSRVVFTPAADKLDDAPFGKFETSEFYIPDAYPGSVIGGYNEATVKDDYGLIVFQEDISKKTGYFGLGIMAAEAIKKEPLQTAGYPADKRPALGMWGATGHAKEIDEGGRIVSEDIYIFPGQSGSLVWIEENSNYYGVGVIASRMAEQIDKRIELKKSKITWIDKDRFLQIQNWAKKRRCGEELNWKNQYKHTDHWKNDGSPNDIFYRGDFLPKSIKENYITFNIKKINLEDNAITSEGITVLSKVFLPQLEELNLEKNKVGYTTMHSRIWSSTYAETYTADGIIAIANANWPNLKKLNLKFNHLTNVDALARTNWLHLEELDLSGNEINAINYLCRARWPNLKKLILQGATLKNVDCLSQTNWLNLKVLDLSVNALKNVDALARPNWLHLEELNLSGTYVEQINILCTANWPNLKQLAFVNTCIRDGGASHLKNAGWLKLEKIDLANTAMTDEGVEDFIKGASLRWTNLESLRLGTQFNRSLNREEIQELERYVSDAPSKKRERGGDDDINETSRPAKKTKNSSNSPSFTQGFFGEFTQWFFGEK